MKRSSSQGPTGLKGDNFDEDEAFDSLDEQLLDLTLSPVPNFELIPFKALISSINFVGNSTLQICIFTEF